MNSNLDPARMFELVTPAAREFDSRRLGIVSSMGGYPDPGPPPDLVSYAILESLFRFAAQ